MTSPRMVFVVGVGRSGTSLLQAMLNAHPDICFPPETAFLRRFLGKPILENCFKRGGVEAVMALLKADERVGRLGLGEPQTRAIVESADRNAFGRSVYLELLKAYARHRNKTRFLGDKDPRCIEHIPLIQKLFPAAFLIHILRDPRDVLASKKKAAWSRDRSSYYHLFANKVQFAMGRKQGPRLLGNRYLEVRYEDLIQDPEKALTSICRMLDTPFSSQMLAFSESGKTLVSERELSWKKETLGPLLKQNRNKWKDQLSPWETVLAERLCRQAMATGRYMPSDRGHLSPGQRLALFPMDLAYAGGSLLYRLMKGQV